MKFSKRRAAYSNSDDDVHRVSELALSPEFTTLIFSVFFSCSIFVTPLVTISFFIIKGGRRLLTSSDLLCWDIERQFWSCETRGDWSEKESS